jgi:hypothetical protein
VARNFENRMKRNWLFLPFSSSSIRTDDNAVLDGKVFADPSKRTGLCVEVVYWNIEETLDLTGVEIHCDYVIAPSDLKHIGHELSCDGCTRFVFFVLTRIWEIRDHGGYSACGCCFASVDHDKKLHESITLDPE